MNQRVAWVFGATGLIGRHLVEFLSQNESYSQVHVFSRRDTGFSHPKIQLHIVDFQNLKSELTNLEPGDLFCCLGTTMKKAGSKEAFRFVDYDLPVKLAHIAHEKGAEKYLIVTAMGADPSSMIFYNQVKGETERDIQKYSFKQIAILRPSLLLGDRNENRVGENVGKIVMGLMNPLMIGPMKKYKAIEGKTVAKAMVSIALENPNQVVFLNDELHEWGIK